MEKRRNLIYYKDYYLDFYDRQTDRVKRKIDWTMDIVKTAEVIPEQYLKHIVGSDSIYEIRIQSGSNAFRIFCFFDKDNVVVLGHGFQKKTQKTPQNEIERAISIKKTYEKEKSKIVHYPRGTS